MDHVVVVIECGKITDVYSTNQALDVEIVDLDIDIFHDNTETRDRLAAMLKYEKELKRIETN
jgi:hypothetical protein